MADKRTDTPLGEGLSELLDEFRRKGLAVKDLLETTDFMFDSLGSEVELEQTMSTLISDEVRNTIDAITKDPSIIVVGQTNSGKSTLINEILGKRIVTESDTRCTGRMVTLEYMDTDKPILIVRDKNGTVLDEEKMNDDYIQSDKINLSDEDRNNASLVQSEVIIKVNNPILESGLKIVDSPGRNENPILDSIVIDHLESILPLIIYVIDGEKLVTNQDKNDILQIRSIVPPEFVFYVVTKVDPPEKDLRGLTIQDRRKYCQDIRDKQKRTVFDQLIDIGVIDESVPYDCCQNLHALSSIEVRNQRPKRKKKPKSFYVDDFREFLGCLRCNIKQQLEWVFETAVRGLVGCHVECLDVFINTAKFLKGEGIEVKTLLADVKKEELQLCRELEERVINSKTTIEKDIKDMLQHERNKIIKNASVIKFYDIETEFVWDTHELENHSDKITDFLLRELLIRIQFIIETNFCQKEGAIHTLDEKMKKLEEKCNVGAGPTLRKLMMEHYRFKMSKHVLKQNFLVRVKSAFKRYLALVMNNLKKVVVRTREIDVVGEWNKSLVADMLNNLIPSKLSDAVVETLKLHINSTHESFCDTCPWLEKIHNEQLDLNENRRKKFCRLAPKIALLELKAYDLLDRGYIERLKKIKPRLGSGAEGMVYKSVDAESSNAWAMKIVRTYDKDSLEACALELHYSRQLHHQNILPTLGVAINDEGLGRAKLKIRMELKYASLEDKIASIPCLRKRLNIGLQIAFGIDYLHDNGLLHRDIKPGNVLLSESYEEAWLSDFGHMKPEGIVNNSYRGTPIFMADEILKQDRVYDKSVDIFSFGILLWVLCEGNGNIPGYAETLPTVHSVLVSSARGNRPERRDYFREDCWRIMNWCWRCDSAERPTIKQVVYELEEVLKDPDLSWLEKLNGIN